MGRLFGTDGVRGIANTELSPALAMKIGKAAAVVLSAESSSRPTFLIGRDTRLSGKMLESAVAAGLCSVGADVILLGVVPTPAVAYLIRKLHADAGVMISASHNPFEFNGIKLFSGEGYKVSDSSEEKIEELVLGEEASFPTPFGKSVGKITRAENVLSDYVDYVVSTVEGDLSGLRIALDCANGSSSFTAKDIFTRLGADVEVLNASPDGLNINDNCGSTHIEGLCSYMREHHLDAGLAFDGDADRCFAVDENGAVLNGDTIIAAFAEDLKSRNRLNGSGVVCTVMSNMGFERFCEDHGISCLVTDVGDRCVIEKMRQGGYNLGGEQCGHVMLLDHTTSDDGQLTGAHLLSMMKRRETRLSSYTFMIRRYPQILVNIRVSSDGKKRFSQDREILQKTQMLRKALAKRGKIVVRISGTEPLVRVMVQGEDIDEIERIASEMADYIKERLS